MKFLKSNLFIMLLVMNIFFFQRHYCHAQNEKGEIVINAGIGYSTINEDIFEFGSDYAGEGIKMLSVYPVYNCSIDYGFGKVISLGFSASNQSLVLDNLNDWWVLGGVNSIVSRTNIGLRFLVHLNSANHRKFDNYIGLRLGDSYWNDSGDPALNNTIKINYWYPDPSVQLLYGIRFYFSQSIGIHAEFGIGTPYFAEGGLTIKINTHKSPMNSTGGQEAK